MDDRLSDEEVMQALVAAKPSDNPLPEIETPFGIVLDRDFKYDSSGRAVLD